MSTCAYCHRISTYAPSYTQKWLNKMFIWLSVQIQRKPLMFIAIGLLITIACSFGLFGFYIENRFLYMVVPRQSAFWARYLEYIDQFGEEPPMMSILITTEQTGNILEPPNLNQSYDLFNIIYNEDDIKYKDLLYTDLCMTDYPSSSECSSTYSNIFGAVFQNNITKWQNKQSILNTVNLPGASIEYYTGGIQYENNSITKATVLRLFYELEASNHDNTYAFQKEFDDYWADHSSVPNSNLSKIYHLTDRSVDDELNRIFVVDAGVFSSAFIGMLIYLMFLLGSFNCVGFRSWLALSVVLIIICSFTVGCGLAVAFGVDLSMTAMLVPYILIGVGVDDMIILCDSFDRYDNDLTASLQFSGLSISLTSLCSFLAFFIASLTPNVPPTVVTFCVIASISFLALYFIQFVIFVPLMVYDNKRMKLNRNFCCCCYQHETKYMDKKQKCNLEASCILKKSLLPILKYKWSRWIIIVIFLVILCLAGYVMPLVSRETDAATMVPGDSFVLDYLSVFENSFDSNIPIECGLVIQGEDFSEFETRDNVYQLFDVLENHKNYISISNWLQPFEEWLQNERLIDINNISNHEFYEELTSFINVTEHKSWEKEIFYGYNIDNDSYYISATRFYLFAFKAEAYDQQWSEYVDFNNIMSDSSVNGYVFEAEYGLAYIVDIIFTITIENMIFCAIGVVIILSLFMDLRLAMFCFIMVVMIDIWLFGWMWMFDVALEPVTYSSLVMAVGLTVDYIIHISLAISHVKPKDINDYTERLSLAMTEMGGSVLKGALTTLLGGFPLLFSNSKGFRLFYVMVSGIVICALLHGLIFVPAVLGEIQCIYRNPNSFNESQQETSLISLSTKNMTDESQIYSEDKENGYGAIIAK